MGLSFSDLYSYLFGKKEVKIAMFGLDGAGKSMILHKLKFSEVVPSFPTTRRIVEKIDYKDFSFTIPDFGASNPVRWNWKHYLEISHGLIYVVDSNDRERIDEARQELMGILKEKLLPDAVLLVFAHKQDLPNVMSISELTEKLGLEDIRDRPWHVQPTTILFNGSFYKVAHMAVPVLDIILFAIEVPFFLYHLSFMIVLLSLFIRKVKGFCTSFFYVTFTICIADWLYYMLITIMYWRLPRYDIPELNRFYLENEWSACQLFIFGGYIAELQYVGQLLLTFNRFSLLWMPTSYSKIWSQPWYFLLLFLIPLCVEGAFIGQPCVWIPIDGGGYRGDFVDLQVHRTNSQIVSITFIGYLVLSIVMGIMSSFRYLKMRSKKNAQHINRKEIPLLFHTFVLVIAQTLKTININMFYWYAANRKVLQGLQMTFPLTNDISVWVTPVGLLILR
ncbi:hypothetical protein FO519_002961 [Halicephalobus sp. NKZ332]|nr:hypothetical protein FO519_002961 [Halicephalobus sp. NKZ332]